MKYFRILMLIVVFFLYTQGIALANSVEQEKKDLLKIQNILEKAVVLINQIANQRIAEQKFRESMDSRIVNKLVFWGHDKILEKRHIDTVVVHSIYDALGMNPYDVDSVMYELAIYDVSSHYLISRNGVIYRLVRDNDLAWHAGRSQLFDGRTSVNKFSIGIELLHHEKEEVNELQYQSLVDLIKYLQLEHQIKHITGHTNISLTKKTDPWNFNWMKFNQMFNK